MRRQHHRRLAAAVVGLVVAVAGTLTVGLLAGGCSGSSGSSGPQPSGPQPSGPQTSTAIPTPSWTMSYPPSTGGPFTPSERASTALTAAKVAAANAGSVHLQGLLPIGKYVVLLDLDVAGNAARGKLSLGGGTADVIAVNAAVYLKGDVAFWRIFEGGSRPVMAGCWVQVSATTSPVFGGLLTVLPVARWLDNLVPVGQKHAEVPGKTVDGKATFGIRKVTAASAEIHVATTKPGYAVLIVPEQGGAVKLSAWDAKVATIAPPTGEVLDATRTFLGG